jgi:hypothetical protein
MQDGRCHTSKVRAEHRRRTSRVNTIAAVARRAELLGAAARSAHWCVMLKRGN